MSNNTLRRLLDALKHTAVQPSAHSGQLGDVAFELTTLDSFVAGIASMMVSGRIPPFEDQAVLERPMPLKGEVWTTEDGANVDLRDFPAFLEQARLIERLRKECLVMLSH